MSDYKIPVEIPGLQFFEKNGPFALEAGGALPRLTVGFHTFGEMNAAKSNVIWVCHALTANSNVADWWAGMFGAGRIFDPEKYFIVCANIIGSNYGTTGARSFSPDLGKNYGPDFPLVTIRDLARAHDLLRLHLGISKIKLAIGGSCGGHQVLEMAAIFPETIEKIALLVTSARETAWAIAIHQAQRLAIEADQTWRDDNDRAGAAGLEAARGMGLIGYRTFEAYQQNQLDGDEKMDDFRAASYIRHQGKKLENRFFAQPYWHLTKTLDSHNIGRGRGGAAAVLREIKQPAFVLSIDSDVLIPPSEQRFLAENLTNSNYFELKSPFGHDGFLIETEAIGRLLLDWV